MEIANKTIEELRAIGFTDVMSFNMKPDQTGQMRPHLDAEEKRKVMDMANQMQEDKDDPESHFDTMGDNDDENQSLDRPKNESER